MHLLFIRHIHHNIMNAINTYTLSLTNILAVSVHFFISISYTSTLFTRNEPKVHYSLNTISIGTVGNTQSDYRGDMVAIELIIRVVNDTQSQSFETVSNAKIKVSKQYQMLKSKFRNSIKC